MTRMHEERVLSDLVAVDIGNSRAKLGLFHCECPGERLAAGDVSSSSETLLPKPVNIFDLPIRHDTGEFDSSRLLTWCNQHLSNKTTWRIASVHRAAAARLYTTLSEWSKETGHTCPIQQLTYRNLTLPIRVDEPARVAAGGSLKALGFEAGLAGG